MMQLKANQMYLETTEQYALIRRLAVVRVQMKALAVEEAQLETKIRTMMEPQTELVDMAFLNQQHDLRHHRCNRLPRTRSSGRNCERHQQDAGI